MAFVGFLAEFFLESLSLSGSSLSSYGFCWIPHVSIAACVGFLTELLYFLLDI